MPYTIPVDMRRNSLNLFYSFVLLETFTEDQIDMLQYDNDALLELLYYSDYLDYSDLTSWCVALLDTSHFKPFFWNDISKI